jgi:hypothetical protein
MFLELLERLIETVLKARRRSEHVEAGLEAALWFEYRDTSRVEEPVFPRYIRRLKNQC